MSELEILDAQRKRNHSFKFLNFLRAKKEMKELSEVNTNEKLYVKPPDEFCANCSHNLECGDYERSNCPLYKTAPMQ